MNHPKQHTLSAYLDNEIIGEERHRINEHLTMCTVCTAIVVSIRETSEQVKSIKGVELSSRFALSVSTAVRARSAQDKKWSAIERVAERVLSGIAVAVVLLFLWTAMTEEPERVNATQTAGLLDLYIRDSTVSRFVTAESITREDVLAAVLIQGEVEER